MAEPEEHEATRPYLRLINTVHIAEDKPLMVPPLNFGMVTTGVFRSGYPNSKNFPFLKKLGIRTIVYLCPAEYLSANKMFAQQNFVTIHHFSMGEGNLEPFVSVPSSVIEKALSCVADKSQHPVLIHCDKGNHRTGLFVGCLRRAMNWSLTPTFAEYRRYTGNNVRVMDLQNIERFQPNVETKRLLLATAVKTS
eukprot:m.37603 g.37603  ORF g.37603 m.37603 type:complete len:194 (-) comp17716_c0_seq1:60-641(-)